MRVLSAAAAVPETAVGNDAIEARLGLERGWIERRTGVRQRPTARSREATSDLAVRAGNAALERAGIPLKDVGLLLLATSTPDHLLPPTAPLVAHRLGLPQSGAIDLAGACAGFLYALVLGSSFANNQGKPVLVIGANVLTRRTNQADPATAGLFSDGAGAVVLAPAEPSNLLGSFVTSDGSGYEAIGIQAGGSREPLTHGALDEGRNLMAIRRGTLFFRQAVHGMVEAGEQAMKSAGLDANAVDWWIPHQANSRIIEDAGKSLGIRPERTVNVVGQYGNSSAATIPIALAYALDAGKICQENIILFTAVGAGLVSAGAVVRWS
jgi:3-oxoacyl-[acyl-carrier-protein] synthase III